MQTATCGEWSKDTSAPGSKTVNYVLKLNQLLLASTPR